MCRNVTCACGQSGVVKLPRCKYQHAPLCLTTPSVYRLISAPIGHTAAIGGGQSMSTSKQKNMTPSPPRSCSLEPQAMFPCNRGIAHGTVVRPGRLLACYSVSSCHPAADTSAHEQDTALPGLREAGAPRIVASLAAAEGRQRNVARVGAGVPPHHYALTCLPRNASSNWPSMR